VIFLSSLSEEGPFLNTEKKGRGKKKIEERKEKVYESSQSDRRGIGGGGSWNVKLFHYRERHRLAFTNDIRQKIKMGGRKGKKRI